MKETPYMRGYKAGRSGEKREPEVYTTKSEYAAYVMGYTYGQRDAERNAA